MKFDICVFLCDDDNLRFFGEGPCRLLHLIEETGSLRAAALSMGMAYTKALHLMKRAEKNLGFSLTARTIGGKGGGGSVLTPEAKEFYMIMKPGGTPAFRAAATSILKSFLNTTETAMERKAEVNFLKVDIDPILAKNVI